VKKSNKFFSLAVLFSFWVLLLIQQASAEIIKATSFTSGAAGTQTYEEFAFYLHANGDVEIVYRYGADWKEVDLEYIPSAANNNASFKVRFANDYTLNIIPKGAKLFIFDDAGNYAKEFAWKYEGPVAGRGTFCNICVEESEAIEFIQENFAKR